MSRRPATAVALVVTVGLLVGSCAPASTSPPSPTSPVVGVVISVDSAGLNDVHGFELRTAAGLTLKFEIGVLENATEFPPGHLKEHIATSSAVRVFFHVDGPRLVVYRLEDG